MRVPSSSASAASRDAHLTLRRVERQQLLVGILCRSRGRRTLQELADELDVTSRTISRDIRRLRESGVPIDVAPGRSGGALVRATPEPRSVHLDIEEIAALVTSLTTVGPTASEPAESAMSKLAAALSEPRTSGPSWPIRSSDVPGRDTYPWAVIDPSATTRIPVGTSAPDGVVAVRPPEPSDAAAFHRLFGDPEVMRYIGDGAVRDLTYYEAFVAGEARSFEAAGHGLGTATLDGVPAGFVGVHRWTAQWGPVGEFEIGWRLGREFQGRSVASRGARIALAALPGGADGPMARGLVAMIHEDNAASLVLAARLGLAPAESYEIPGGAGTAVCCRVRTAARPS